MAEDPGAKIAKKEDEMSKELTQRCGGIRMCLAYGGLLALALTATGCFAPMKAVVARSAIEQELTSAAARRSVERLDLAPLDRDRRYRLEVAAPLASDLDILYAHIATRLGEAGIRIVDKDADADLVLRATLPFSGVDAEASLLGVPFVVPGLPVSFGDISLYRSGTLTGRARIELAVWRPDGALERQLTPAEASRYYRNVTLLTFVGPFRFTDLEQPLPGSEP